MYPNVQYNIFVPSAYQNALASHVHVHLHLWGGPECQSCLNTLTRMHLKSLITSTKNIYHDFCSVSKEEAHSRLKTTLNLFYLANLKVSLI